MATTDSNTSTVSGVSTGIRIGVALVVAIILAIFIFLWDGNILPKSGIPEFIGPYIFLPLIAVVLVMGADCLIQFLSCGSVQWALQAKRASVVPLPFWLVNILLKFIPILRWPIEGLVQRATPSIQKGLSSAFYMFFTGLYTQSILISLSQLC